MSIEMCPFIGIETDSDTAVGFPSPRNLCHRNGTPAPTSIAHQAKFCMAGEHVNCPIFQQQAGAALVAAAVTGTQAGATPVVPSKKGRPAQPKPFNKKASASAKPTAYPVRRRAKEILLPLLAVAGVTAIVLAMILILPPSSQFLVAPPVVVTDTPTPKASLVTVAGGETSGGSPMVVSTTNLSPSPPPTSTRVLTRTSTPRTSTVTKAVTSTQALIPTIATPCGHPTGWVQYTVRSGDTLSALSRVLNISIAQLQIANCMGSSTFLYVGQLIWTPWIPPTQIIPTEVSPTIVPSETETPVPTEETPSATPVTPSVEPTIVVPTIDPTVGVPPTESPTP